MSDRAQNEIEHGKKLLEMGAERIWGWGTPAGRVRAARRAQWIERAVELGPGRRVLEIGCGTGIFTEHFAATGAEIVAVDISEELIERARARNLPPNVQLVHAPFEALRADQPFDAVVGSSVLHHLEVEPALDSIYSLLKPGGLIGFGEPNMLNPQVMAQKNLAWLKEHMGDSPDETAFFRWELDFLLHERGFEEIEILPLDWLHPLTHRSFIRLTQKMGRLLERVPLIKEAAGSLYIRARRPFAAKPGLG
jgi:SAM-dependent methyltransferase